jgi:hypothetical protein
VELRLHSCDVANIENPRSNTILNKLHKTTPENPMKSTLVNSRARVLAVFAGLALATASAQTTLFSDNFDGDPATSLNGTTPDITTVGATWVAMNGTDSFGRIYADGDIQITGGASATRGGSATLAFTPQNGFIYTLDMSATGLNSSAANTGSPLLLFGFAKGQSSANGSGTWLLPSSATVEGQAIQQFVTKTPYTGSANNASANDTSSIVWPVSIATGGSIDLRVVLDTSAPGNWTATWYAKKPADAGYSLTRATDTVTDTGITSVGFGVNHFTSGKVTNFTLIAEATTALIADHFNGLGADALNGTAPDVTPGGETWMAMNNATNGRVLADGTIDVPSPGGASANRGGSATVAFTPQDGYIYTLDLAARGLDSAAANTQANRLYFGFAEGQSAANGTANQLQVGSATVTGKVTEGYMTLVGYSGANGIANRTYNSTGSEEVWLALPGAFGGNINLRIVLDTSSPAWTATWYAKQPATNAYLVTRATEVVADKVITSIGFGLAQFTSGRVTGFSLIRETGAVSVGYSSWANTNSAGLNLDDDHDNDGVSNGTEYFIGGPNGNTTGFTALPGVTDTGGTLSVTYTHAADYTGIYGTDYVVETSATLAPPWAPEVADPDPGFTVTFPSATEVKYTFPAGTKNFARLKVTGP